MKIHDNFNPAVLRLLAERYGVRTYGPPLDRLVLRRRPPTPTALERLLPALRALATGEAGLIRPVEERGATHRTSNDDRSSEIVGILDRLGFAGRTSGNDAPRGGRTGDWIRVPARKHNCALAAACLTAEALA